LNLHLGSIVTRSRASNLQRRMTMKKVDTQAQKKVAGGAFMWEE